MAFFRSIKKIFGFSPDDDIEEDMVIEARTSSEVERASAESTSEAPSAPALSQPDINTLSGNIFTAIIKLFNDFQPDFVKQCLDTDAQKQYLMNAIDSSLRQQLEEATEIAGRIGVQRWEGEREKLAQEMDQLKGKYNRMKTQQEELRNAKLSADRQRRALNERIHDLDNQVATLAAEKEQYELENRSMLNKLRIAGVTGTVPGADSDYDPSKIDELNKTVTELKAENAELEKINEELKQSNARIEERMSTLSNKNIQLEKDLSEADKKIELLTLSIDQAKAKGQISEAMLNEWRKKAADSSRKYEEAQSEIKSLKSSMEAAAEAHSKSEETLRKMIEATRQLDNKQTTPDSSESLESDPAQPLVIEQKAKTEPAEPEYAANELQPKPKRKRGRPKKPKISAIDDMIDSTDWLVAPPLPKKKDKDEENDDFGYKAPIRKSHPDDDKQLSLW